jgi:hypothetical protein
VDNALAVHPAEEFVREFGVTAVNRPIIWPLAEAVPVRGKEINEISGTLSVPGVTFTVKTPSGTVETSAACRAVLAKLTRPTSPQTKP